MPYLRSALLALALVPCSALADWSCQSGNSQAALLELYTSQGCSSCPPADRWLTSLKQRDDLWTDVVPVAWHVTYWDYLGWRDPFGHRSNDQRQRSMAAAAGAQVYTPGMFMNRGEFRSWRRLPPGGMTSPAIEVGSLSADAEGSQVAIRFRPVEGLTLSAPRAELVYLRSDRRTDVKRGENRGRELQHDFVAGTPTVVKLRRDGDDWIGTVDKVPHPDSVAVALWVTDRAGNYLQATGGWLHSKGAGS
jgi:hypothetical protein